GGGPPAGGATPPRRRAAKPGGGLPLAGRDDELDVVAPGPALDVDVADVDPAAVANRLVLEQHRARAAGIGVVLGIADLVESGEVPPGPGAVVARGLRQEGGGVLGANRDHPSGAALFLDHRSVVALPGPGLEPGWHADTVTAGPIGKGAPPGREAASWGGDGRSRGRLGPCRLPGHRRGRLGCCGRRTPAAGRGA